MFASGFAESSVSDLGAPYPSTRSAVADIYHYDSDSDLEEEEGGPELYDPSSDSTAGARAAVRDDLGGTSSSTPLKAGTQAVVPTIVRLLRTLFLS